MKNHLLLDRNFGSRLFFDGTMLLILLPLDPLNLLFFLCYKQILFVCNRIVAAFVFKKVCLGFF